MSGSDKKKKTVTQEDVAKLAGVTRSVVSCVLNRSDRPVAQETRDKILKAMAELGYRPNVAAQNLTRTRYNSIAEKQFGILMSDISMLSKPYYSNILAGIHATAHESNHHIHFIRFFHDLKDPLLFDELIHEDKISGLIMISLDQSIKSKEDEKLVAEIKERIDNIVCIEWTSEGLPSINFSRQEAAYKACKYLISKGHKDILYIGPNDERCLGFQQALLESGNLENIKKSFFGVTPRDGYEFTNRIIESGELPEAIVGGTDELSIGILRSLNEHKIDVPDKLALISIDNIEMSEFTNPPLTTVNVETWEMGKFAVMELIRRAKNKDQMPSNTILPTELVIRESC